MAGLLRTTKESGKLSFACPTWHITSHLWFGCKTMLKGCYLCLT